MFFQCSEKNRVPDRGEKWCEKNNDLSDFKASDGGESKDIRDDSSDFHQARTKAGDIETKTISRDFHQIWTRAGDKSKGIGCESHQSRTKFSHKSKGSSDDVGVRAGDGSEGTGNGGGNSRTKAEDESEATGDFGRDQGAQG